jgi:hypothetical protein
MAAADARAASANPGSDISRSTPPFSISAMMSLHALEDGATCADTVKQ